MIKNFLKTCFREVLNIFYKTENSYYKIVYSDYNLKFTFKIRTSKNRFQNSFFIESHFKPVKSKRTESVYFGEVVAYTQLLPNQDSSFSPKAPFCRFFKHKDTRPLLIEGTGKLNLCILQFSCSSISVPQSKHPILTALVALTEQPQTGH